MSKRYLLVKVVADSPLSRDQFADALNETVRKNFGEFGLSRIGPNVVRYEQDKARAIIACKTEGASELHAAISLISEYKGASVVPLVVGVSGTMKALTRMKRSR